MDLDQQIEKTLQKFSARILELTSERERLEKEKNELLFQCKHEEGEKTAALENYNATNKKAHSQADKLAKLENSLAQVREDLKNNDNRLTKQKNTNSIYEQTMLEKINTMKNSHEKAEEERNYKLNLEKERLRKLTNDNDEMKKTLVEEEKLIEKLLNNITVINEKEVSRSAMLNTFIKLVGEPRYKHYAA